MKPTFEWKGNVDSESGRAYYEIEYGPFMAFDFPDFQTANNIYKMLTAAYEDGYNQGRNQTKNSIKQFIEEN